MLGSLNLIAPLLSMCFLLCYACMNFNSFILDILKDPHWRPKWRWFHWSVGLFGFILCVTTMFLISILYAVIAWVMMILLLLYIVRTSINFDYGSALTGIRFHVAIRALLSVDMKSHLDTNWKPQLLLLYTLREVEQLENIAHRSKAMVACYPGGGARYVRHCDNSCNVGKGDRCNGRRLTAIIYLNEGWTQLHGGELRLFAPFAPKGVPPLCDVAPLADRLVLFYADYRVPHEVLAAHSERLAVTASAGWRDVVAGRTELDDAVLVTQIEGLDYLPVGGHGEEGDRPVSLAGEQLLGLVERLRAKYDFVVIEFPSIERRPEVATALRGVDAALLAVRARKTKRAAVRHTAAVVDEAAAQLVGIALQSGRA